MLARSIGTFGFVALCGSVATVEAQTCVDTAGFVRMRGADTLNLEKVESSALLTTGIQRASIGVVRYRLRTGTDTARLSTEVWPAGTTSLSDPLAQSGIFQVFGTTAQLTAVRPAKRGVEMQIQTNRVAPRSAPLLLSAIGLEERLVRNARRVGRSVDVPTIYLAGDGYAPVAHIAFIGEDSAIVRFADDFEARFRIDSVGRILSGEYTWMKGGARIQITRVDCSTIARLIGLRDSMPQR